MLKKLRLFAKQILCFHEEQNHVGTVTIMGGQEKLTQWECAKCHSQRLSDYVPLKGDTMTRYRYKGKWNIRNIVFHKNGAQDVYHQEQKSAELSSSFVGRRRQL